MVKIIYLSSLMDPSIEEVLDSQRKMGMDSFSITQGYNLKGLGEMVYPMGNSANKYIQIKVIIKVNL